MKACNQCEHYSQGFGAFRNGCFRPTSEINPVTARPYALGEKCWRERSNPFWWWQDRCGPDAKYFEAKEALGDGA